MALRAVRDRAASVNIISNSKCQQQAATKQFAGVYTNQRRLPHLGRLGCLSLITVAEKTGNG